MLGQRQLKFDGAKGFFSIEIFESIAGVCLFGSFIQKIL